MRTRYRILIWLFISGLLYLLFLGSRINEIDKLEQVINVLLEMREVDAHLNESILKNRYNIEKNYDRIESSVNSIKNLIYILETFSNTMNFEKDSKFKDNLEILKKDFLIKSDNIEKFKENNAIYSNSISLIPISIRINIRNSSSPKELLDSLLKNILYFNLKNDKKSQLDANEIVQKLIKINTVKKDEELNVLIKYCLIALNEKEALDKYLNNIIESNFILSIEEVAESLTFIYKSEFKKSSIYSVLLYSLSVGVLIYTAFILLKLIISSYSLKKVNIDLRELNVSLEKFVPKEVLQLLSIDSISTIKLGKSVKREMTVLFSDIRSFTSLSEKMSPEENFEFINSYLKHMGPIVRQHNGFIDKFIGDAIMALFKGEGEDAILAGIQMLKELKDYNEIHRNTSYRPPLEIGIGVHAGEMMFGTIGENNRMETTVISDTVNLASRIESITKFYGVGFLISEHIYESLDHPDKFKIRYVDKVRVKGKNRPIKVFEVYSADPPEMIEKKDLTKIDLEKAINKFYDRDPKYALELLKRCKYNFPDDPVIRYHHDRCKKMIPKLMEPEEEWDDATEPHF
jgi:class 3 adenylate cyclase